MKKTRGILNLLIILLLIGSAIAAGSSSGSSGSSSGSTSSSPPLESNTENKSTDNKAITPTTVLTEEEKRELRRVCESTSDRKERIKCRLQYIYDNKEEFRAPSGVLPEACRRLDNKNICQQLYDRSQQCYELNGTQKNKCFKRIAGFAKAKLKDENLSGREDKAKDYVILLLYDIQEKIESAVENERVDPEKGAEIIDQIVEIKEKILSGESKYVVKPMIQSLRNNLQELKSIIDNS